MPHILIVDHESFPDDIPPVALYGPFETVVQAQAFAEDFREANDLPREATPESNEAWTERGWMFAIVEPSTGVERWEVP